MQSPGCSSLPEGGMFAAQGCQSSENSLAQLGCIFFGCTKWKILPCRQNRCCEEEHGAGCPLQELGLEQQAPHMAKLCQLWAAREQCWHHPQPSHAGNSFRYCKSPGHTPWKSLKVKSPHCLPTAAGDVREGFSVHLPVPPEIMGRWPAVGLLV